MMLFAAAAQRAAAETIEAALAKAYENNPQLNAQRAIVRQTDEGVPQALSGYRPTVSANASVARQYSDIKQTIPPLPPALPNGVGFSARGLTTPQTLGGTVAQTFFNGERTANRVRAAESQVSAARETLRMMEESVLLSAATVYMDMSRDSANLEVQQNNVRVLQRTLQDTRNRFAAGQVTSTDVAQSEAQLAAGEATLHAAESTLMTTRANYRRIIGDEPNNLAPVSAVDRLAPSTLNAAIAVGLAENPSITAALYGVDVAQLQVKIAEGALWPSLTGQYNIQQQIFPQLLSPKLYTNTVALNLSVPIYQGGAEYSAIRLDKETLDQDRLNVDQTALWMFARKPFAGWGIGRFQVVNTYHHQQWAPDVPWIRGYGIVAHESELGILADVGVIGLALYICVLALVIRRLWTAYRTLPDHDLCGEPLAVTAIMALATLICAGLTVDIRCFDFPMLPIFLLAGITIGWSDRYQRSQTAAGGEIVEPVMVRHG